MSQQEGSPQEEGGEQNQGGSTPLPQPSTNGNNEHSNGEPNGNGEHASSEEHKEHPEGSIDPLPPDGQPGQEGEEASPTPGEEQIDDPTSHEQGEEHMMGEQQQEEGAAMPPVTLGEEEEEDMPAPNRLDMLTNRSRSAQSSRGASRPGSAVMNLRGSRPNSAAIAQEIEGFEDDFMERVEEEEDVMEEEYDSEEEQDFGPSVEELIDRAQQEQMRLQEANEALQKNVRLALDFRNRGRPAVNRDTSKLDGVTTRYRSQLKQWVDALEERDRVEGHYQTTIFDMKSNLEERIKRADDVSKAYKHFRLEVARSSEHSKTGRSISDRLLAMMEHEDQEKEEEVQRVRLKNIHLSNQLKRIEQTLRQKEELAEGLHLIDFEQLKIENQSLNEKIEERNEELLKLRKKTTTTVQILTHVREKLQCVEKENNGLREELEGLEASLSSKRDMLGKAKVARDGLRLKGRKIKEASVFITNPALLEDIEVKKAGRWRPALDLTIVLKFTSTEAFSKGWPFYRGTKRPQAPASARNVPFVVTA
uniref:CCDC113/CCDC96 coiled-coil domain-containing protein n=1 Tax=Dunaliella tertiolecta TaxID=3047 RepID=A0A7S3R505_DUNTE